MNTIDDVQFITHERKADSRGYFRRVYDATEMTAGSPQLNFIQSSVSFNTSKGTIRGLHFQASPSLEWKYVTCLSGAVFDCLIDVRKESASYGTCVSFELSEINGASLLIPPGVAHGFQTLLDNTRVHYQMTDQFDAKLSRVLMWNDKSLDIKWPLPLTVMSKADQNGTPWPIAF